MVKKNKQGKKAGQAGKYAYAGLNRIMHEKARLGILTSLAARPDGLLFNELKDLCALTDGNLSRHLQTLEEASLVEVWKGFRNRRPQTLCRLSVEGKSRFFAYLAELEQVLQDAAAGHVTERAQEQTSEKLSADGWAPA